MLYPPNTIQWKKGDIVIHWADAKEPKMLMRVIGYTRDGLCKTQYVDPNRTRQVWTNRVTSLLNPKDFRLDEYANQEEFEAERRYLYLAHTEPPADPDSDTEPNPTVVLVPGLGE
jgi:hypothetical protein